MSQSATIQNAIFSKDESSEKKHRQRLLACWIAAGVFVGAFTVYGFNYYLLNSNERPFSPKHVLLRPSGPIGANLGVFGVLMFFIIFLTHCASAGAGLESREIRATGSISTSSWALRLRW